MQQHRVTARNIQKYLYYNLHTTYSWAKTKGNGLIRAQLVATGAPPSFVTQNCKSQEAATSDRTCAPAAPGTSCFKDVIWAMSHGIQQHPDWYSGLTASSDFTA